VIQIVMGRKTGYNVLPPNAKKAMTSMGHVASQKEAIESGVKVKPRLLIIVWEE
jgi:hypothetical protein